MLKGAIKTKVIGVDISLEETAYAVIDIRGNILARDGFRTADYPNVNDYVTVLCQSIVELIENHSSFDQIRSIGISVPSGNFKTGCIENSPNMPWKGVVPMAAMLRDRLGLAVALGNDCHAVALGEQMFGSAHGLTDFGVMNIGQGLGCAFISNNKVHLGNDGFAGELGHICVEDNGRLCNCGLRGCLERYVAAEGIVQTAREMMAASDAPSLMREVSNLSAKSIAACCDNGDEMAIEVYRRTGYILGIGLATFATLIDPEAIVIAGGVSKAGKWLADPAQESFEQHVFQNIRGKVDIILSTVNDRERDILGASVLAWNVKEYSLFK